MRSISKIFKVVVFLLMGFFAAAQNTTVSFHFFPSISFSSKDLSTVDFPERPSSETEASNRVDIGPFVNVVETDMNGLQLAGLGNISGCSLNGLQLSGIFNYNRALISGAQIAGFSNVNLADVQGLQMAGYSNITRGELEGVQLSGFSNVATQNVDGAQVSGFLNMATQNVSMAQVASFMNYSNSIKGPQVAGYLNVVKEDTRSAQIAGFTNFALAENHGLQLSGFFNYARVNHGIQLSFINYSDSSSGIPIGFLSIVKKGYHVLEVSSTEIFPLNVAFKTGVTRFYNIFEMGVSQENFHATYGIGTLQPLGRKLQLGFDITGSNVFDNDNPFWEDQQYLLRFTPTVNYQLFKKVGIALGPTVNFYVTEIPSEGSAQPLSS